MDNYQSLGLPGLCFKNDGTIPRKKLHLLHVDESAITQGSGADIVITSPQGKDMKFVTRFDFKASNNEAKYEALVIGMRMTHEVGAQHLVAYSDSQLIVKQINGIYEAKKDNTVQYLQQIEELKIKFESSLLVQIPREENVKADCLSKLASTMEDCQTRRITI
ncbi:UNVERIFIED_CONTAM: hypothetical protein Sradi_3862300 [Sesamum radiatum]|uniref:RNase H type-1 domain-containing protein n=1 Tax=Sesamum radiatum TaxID=300843 RepID=A0AAW2Q2G5_SESRA